MNTAKRTKSMFSKSQERGYTLVELLVVIVLLGILAVVVIPQVMQFMGRGQAEAALTETDIVQKAVQAYMADEKLNTIEQQPSPIGILAGTPGIGSYLASDTEWTYCWNERGCVVQGGRTS